MLTIRPVTDDDLADLQPLLRACYCKEFGRDYPHDVLAASLDGMSTIEPALLRAGTYFIALRDSRIIGGGGWAERTPLGQPNDPALASVRKLATHVDEIGRGIGGALMTHIHHSACAAGKTWMHCFASIGAEKFYQRLGYRTLGKAQLPTPNPAIMFDVIEMRLDM